ncbi:helix-turn-helix domain-containing protein [Paraburkholderia oxyphila]|uniref:helix-turn-helix domain-containing protein n=1 Tax=Paraburkholderia oxyphila TaxID=614212 RepID=UPI0012EDB150|nr:LysR family transcriptional regulator [Paraburkholderia oxyphila]
MWYSKTQARHLRCFAAVAEQGSMRAAAEQLGLSATAVNLASNALRRIIRRLPAPGSHHLHLAP